MLKTQAFLMLGFFSQFLKQILHIILFYQSFFPDPKDILELTLKVTQNSIFIKAI